MAALKLSLQPRPLMMRGRGLWKGRSPLSVTSATAVWRLSRELDFFRPKDGPTSLVEEPGRRTERTNTFDLFVVNVLLPPNLKVLMTSDGAVTSATVL